MRRSTPGRISRSATIRTFHSARFIISVAELAGLPDAALPEIAFAGRSNAGKSTAINALAQQKRLAFASKTPGRTQHINLFELGPKDAPDALFADRTLSFTAKLHRFSEAMVTRFARMNPSTPVPSAPVRRGALRQHRLQHHDEVEDH